MRLFIKHFGKTIELVLIASGARSRFIIYKAPEKNDQKMTIKMAIFDNFLSLSMSPDRTKLGN
jgi:hypothetical protein